MKIYKGKIIIGEADLSKKVVLIKGHKNDEELQLGQVAVMNAVPGCIAISIDSFGKLNKFRKNKGYKELILESTMVVDMEEYFKLRDLADDNNNIDKEVTTPKKRVRKTSKGK